jgi:hypothetical protein
MTAVSSHFVSLSGPAFLKFSRRQIKALSFDELQLLVFRSQRLLATVLFKPVQCLFEVMPDEFVIEILLEWLPIEELAQFERALTNHYYRGKYMSLLRDTVHKGVLSVSRNEQGYRFDSGVAEWLESRNIFMRALTFSDGRKDIPHIHFLEHTGSQLLELDLVRCYKISNDRLEKLAGFCPLLQELCLFECGNIADVGVSSLAQHCPRLHTLILQGTQVTDTALAKLAQGCNSLKKLELGGLEITDTGLTKLAEGCTKIEYICLGDCRQIQDAGVCNLVKHCLRIQYLDLTGTKVTDVGLTCIGNKCCELKTLDLSLLKLITDDGLSNIARGCLKLEDLSLFGCVKITCEPVKLLVHTCRKLVKLDVYGTQMHVYSNSSVTRYVKTLEEFLDTYGKELCL